MKDILCGLIALASFSGSALANDPPEVFSSVWEQAARDHLSQAEADGTVGSSFYVLSMGDIVGASHYGLEDISSGRAVDADTIYHWASITKTLNAVALMQLVERDLVSLDDPITEYLPETKQVHNPFGDMEEITLRHLITHSSGFRMMTFPWGGDKPWHPHEPRHWSQIAAMMPFTAIEFEPGSKYAYSNPGSSMLGRVIEEVTGDDIEVYITKNILMPLKMTRSYFDHTPYYLLDDRSNNYVIKDGEVRPQGLDFDTGATTANGGWNAPVSDVAKWLNFWLGVKDEDGVYETVLPRKTLVKMWDVVNPAPYHNASAEQFMGMSFFLINHKPAGAKKPNRYVGHTGGQKAFSSFVYVDPKTKAAVIFSTNTDNEDVSRDDALFGRSREDAFEKLFPALAR